MNEPSIFEAAREVPERLALVGPEGSFTYEALSKRTARACAWLRDAGAARDERPVAIVATNDLACVELYLAAFALGVPALSLHPRLTTSERDALLRRTPHSLVADASWRDSASDASYVPTGSIATERTMAVVHTSGTTGPSRGVALPRRAFLASARASEENLGWQEEDRWLLCLPLAHIGGLSVLTRCVLARRTVALMPRKGPLTPESIVQCCNRYRVTLLSLVPTLLKRILDLGYDLPGSVRAVLLGGAATSPALLQAARARGWPAIATYGMTEACSQVTAQRWGAGLQGSDCGPPVSGMQVRIEPDGTIAVRGASMMSGYYPEDGCPFDAEGWYHTSDLGRLDEAGRLHFLGRHAELIVTGGENVYPLEVECALESHPAVDRACVFALPDPEWGDIVACALVLRGPLDWTTLDGHMRASLAKHKIPRAFAVVDALECNASGKLDRTLSRNLAMPKLQPLRDWVAATASTRSPREPV